MNQVRELENWNNGGIYIFYATNEISWQTGLNTESLIFVSITVCTMYKNVHAFLQKEYGEHIGLSKQGISVNYKTCISSKS
jgi:hypothetical protein